MCVTCNKFDARLAALEAKIDALIQVVEGNQPTLDLAGRPTGITVGQMKLQMALGLAQHLQADWPSTTDWPDASRNPA